MKIFFTELCTNDYHKGFYDCLKDLTHSPEPPYHQFVKALNNLGDTTYYVARCYQDIPTNSDETSSGSAIFLTDEEHKNYENLDYTIVGSAVLHIELKLFRGICHKGHISDLIIKIDYRNLNIGFHFLEFLNKKCHDEFKLYKVSTNCCNDKLKTFYERGNFTHSGYHMVKRNYGLLNNQISVN